MDRRVKRHDAAKSRHGRVFRRDEQVFELLTIGANWGYDVALNRYRLLNPQPNHKDSVKLFRQVMEYLALGRTG